jgi:hypothetical protein
VKIYIDLALTSDADVLARFHETMDRIARSED